MENIVIRRKRLKPVVMIIILSLLDIMLILGGLFVKGIFSKFFCIYCFVMVTILIYFTVESLYKCVIINNDDIYIRYGRRVSSERIIDCEFDSQQRIVGHMKADIITLRYDKHHFFMIDDLEYSNYELLLVYIFKNNIYVKTEYPDQLKNVKRNILKERIL